MFQTGRADRIAAVNAKAVFVFVQSSQSGLGLRNFDLPAAFRRLRHGLLLQRIHPAEPANRLLVEFHDVAARHGPRGFGLKAEDSLRQSNPEFSQFFVR